MLYLVLQLKFYNMELSMVDQMMKFLQYTFEQSPQQHC